MKKYDFDKVINRRGTNCGKWDTMDQKYGRTDLIHLGVADMDFEAPPLIKESFEKIIKAGVMGYTDVSERFYQSITYWYKTHYHVDVQKEWIVFCPRINIACGICVNEFTKPQEEVMMHTPAYGPLKNAVIKNGRKLVTSPLVRKNNKYVIDFEQMEHCITDQTNMLILCSPHNPTTRVFTKEELIRLEEFCVKHELLLFSDEIHADLTSKDVVFETTLSLSDTLKDRLIVASSLTKTFNIPGVIVSHMIIPNEAIRNRVKKEIDRIGMHNPTIFAVNAVETGYTECEEWYEEVLAYINENEQYVREYFAVNFPEIAILDREGTYLLWMDCTKLPVNENQLEKWFIEEANVSVYMGGTFGEEGEGYIRFNMATSKIMLKEALERMKKAYPQLLG